MEIGTNKCRESGEQHQQQNTEMVLPGGQPDYDCYGGMVCGVGVVRGRWVNETEQFQTS